MNIFPIKEESDTEIIVKAPVLGIIFGILLINIVYFFESQLGSMSGPFLITAHFFIGMHIYRSLTRTKVIRKAMKSGINVHMSGRAYSLKNPIVYRVKKSDL